MDTEEHINYILNEKIMNTEEHIGHLLNEKKPSIDKV